MKLTFMRDHRLEFCSTSSKSKAISLSASNVSAYPMICIHDVEKLVRLAKKRRAKR